jgi:hypothetical protein
MGERKCGKENSGSRQVDRTEEHNVFPKVWAVEHALPDLP